MVMFVSQLQRRHCRVFVFVSVGGMEDRKRRGYEKKRRGNQGNLVGKGGGGGGGE